MAAANLLYESLFVAAALRHVVVLLCEQRAIFVALPHGDKTASVEGWLVWGRPVGFLSMMVLACVWKVEETR